MKGKVLTQKNLWLIEILGTGRFLKASFTPEQRKELAKKHKLSDPYGMLHKLEEMGVIVGYVPLLSEEGKKILAGAKSMYGLQSDDKTAEIAVDPLSEFRT